MFELCLFAHFIVSLFWTSVWDCIGQYCTDDVWIDAVPDRVPRRQPHRRSGLATLPSMGAVP